MGKISRVSKICAALAFLLGLMTTYMAILAAWSDNPQEIYSEHPLELVPIGISWLIFAMLFSAAAGCVSETLIYMRRLARKAKAGYLLPAAKPTIIVLSAGCIISLCAGAAMFAASLVQDSLPGALMEFEMWQAGVFIFFVPFASIAETIHSLCSGKGSLRRKDDFSTLICAVGNVAAMAAGLYSLHRICVYRCRYIESLPTILDFIMAFDAWFVVVLAPFLALVAIIHIIGKRRAAPVAK